MRTITIEIPDDLAHPVVHRMRMSHVTPGLLSPSSGTTGA